MHEIGVRLKVWRDAAQLKQDEAAKLLGLPGSTYQNYERGVRAPNTEGWESFARVGINTNWLLTGEGPMLSKNLVEIGEPSRPPSAGDEHRGYVAIPLFNSIRAAAGHGAVVGHEAADDALMFKEQWIRFELGANPQDLKLIRVSGDSMEPTLRAGDVILVDHRTQRPDREGIYILRMDGMLLVKRVQAMPGGVVSITSDNPAFAPWTLKLAELETADVAILGRVVWSGRRL